MTLFQGLLLKITNLGCNQHPHISLQTVVLWCISKTHITCTPGLADPTTPGTSVVCWAPSCKGPSHYLHHSCGCRTTVAAFVIASPQLQLPPPPLAGLAKDGHHVPSGVGAIAIHHPGLLQLNSRMLWFPQRLPRRLNKKNLGG